MIIIVDDREIVTNGYETGFGREGISTTGFSPEDFQTWVETAPKKDFNAVEAFLIGSCTDPQILPKLIRHRSQAPVIALNDDLRLDVVLALFAAGVDDVVRKPVHVREIMARVQAIRRRIDLESEDDPFEAGELRVFSDGRDPEVKGTALALPRRERRILEHLVQNKGKRVTKRQIFNAVYGLFDEDVDESVVESHISKLRKKLRKRLDYDPIESKRFMGYRLMTIGG